MTAFSTCLTLRELGRAFRSVPGICNLVFIQAGIRQLFDLTAGTDSLVDSVIRLHSATSIDKYDGTSLDNMGRNSAKHA
jgi:hypothetical protein